MKEFDSHPALPGVFVMQVPCISTAHIHKEDGALLLEMWADRSHPGIMAEIGECCGHLLHFETDREPDEEWKEFTPDFRHVIRTLQNRGFSYVRFDGGCGDVVPGWPTFEW